MSLKAYEARIERLDARISKVIRKVREIDEAATQKYSESNVSSILSHTLDGLREVVNTQASTIDALKERVEELEIILKKQQSGIDIKALCDVA